MKYSVILFLSMFILASCGTSVIKNDREPNHQSKNHWQELVVDDPGTYLDTKDTEKRLQEQKRKVELLRSCGVSERSLVYQILERDLLFIRLQSWDKKRLEATYLKEMSPQSLQCLQDGSDIPSV